MLSALLAALFLMAAVTKLMGSGPLVRQRSVMKETWQRLLASFVLTSVVGAGTPVAEVSVNVGDEAPDFALSDSAGKAYRLSDFRGKKAVVLEFFRSGDW